MHIKRLHDFSRSTEFSRLNMLHETFLIIRGHRLSMQGKKCSDNRLGMCLIIFFLLNPQDN
jgi:hypothetical protein